MDRKIEKNKLIKQRRMLELSKICLNPAFKVIDMKTGGASSFYSSTLARKEAEEKAKQGQQAFARRIIKLKDNSDK